ncbi:hypothetical protein D3C75_762940 [compost metagenome]
MTVQALEFLEDHLELVGRNARAAVPHFQAQMTPLAAHAEQHLALGVAEGVGQEVLQHPAQQLGVAVDALPAGADVQVDALLLGQGAEFHAEGVVQGVEGEGAALGGEAPAFQARDVQQVGDQVLGRTQRGVEVLDQLLHLAGQRLLVGEGGGEQPRGVQRLHQVVADRREEAGLRLVGQFGTGLGLGQLLVERGQFAGALLDP